MPHSQMFALVLGALATIGSAATTPYHVKTIAKMASYTTAYPDATDAPVLANPIVITWLNETTVNIKGSVIGLVAGSSYDLHIHAGTSCESAATQGKCLSTAAGCPWLKPALVARTVADKYGKASWDYTGYDTQPQAASSGRAMVFHRVYGTGASATTPRMACGLVNGPAFYHVKTIAKMASYTSSYPAATDAPVLANPVVVTWVKQNTVNIKGSVTGLVAGSSYDLHIHAGTSCESAATQGKCLSTAAGCPWLKPALVARTVADKDGKASWDYTGYETQPYEASSGRAMVFHRVYGTGSSATTPRMACGLVNGPAFYHVKTIAKMASYTTAYPDATDAPVLADPVVVTWVKQNTVNIKGSVIGLVAGSSYDVHIHAGTSCESAATQGKCLSTAAGCPWLKPALVARTVADKDGKASWDYTGYDTQPQEASSGRAMVFHRVFSNVSTPRMACGLVNGKAPAATAACYKWTQHGVDTVAKQNKTVEYGKPKVNGMVSAKVVKHFRSNKLLENAIKTKMFESFSCSEGDIVSLANSLHALWVSLAVGALALVL